MQVPYNVSVVSSSYLSIKQVSGLVAPTFDYSTGTATATAASYWIWAPQRSITPLSRRSGCRCPTM